MKTVGIYMVILGIGSIILNQLGYEFSLLVWIDNWGEGVGLAIRGGAILVGAILFALGAKQQNNSTAES